MKRLLCWLFGHERDLVTMMMNDIKQSAVNRKQLRIEIVRCLRCGKELV